MEKDLKVNLSNDGFASFYKEIIEMVATPVIDDRGIVTFKYKDVPSGKFVIKDREKYLVYKKRLFEIIKRRKISNTDKIFFTKNSTFPKNTFNSYTKGAKRVINIDKADKIVINCNILNEKLYNYYSNNKLIDGKILIVDRVACEKILNNKNFSSKNPRYIFNIKYLLNDNFSYRYRKLETFLMDYLEENEKNICTTERWGDPSRYLDLKNKKTLDILLSGYPISKYIDDEAVNQYTAKLKTPLSIDNYQLILSSLKNGTNNITMGLKLLENMDISNALPYFYAIILQAYEKNYINILYNPIYSGVGMKNIRSLYDIDSLYTNKRNTFNLNLIQKIHDKFSKEEDKLLFRSIIKEEIENALKQEIGSKAYALLKIVEEDLIKSIK